MIKKRVFAAKGDFKTGILCKLSLLLGIVLVLTYIILKISSFFIDKSGTGFLRDLYYHSNSPQAEATLALGVISLAVGVIFYFFHCQFTKLAEIAEEIENEEIK
jgi:hypothetical protein